MPLQQVEALSAVGLSSDEEGLLETSREEAGGRSRVKLSIAGGVILGGAALFFVAAGKVFTPRSFGEGLPDKVARAQIGSVMAAFMNNNSLSSARKANKTAVPRSLGDTCYWANDGECDVPDYCNEGSDDADCKDPGCPAEWANDGYCDVPMYCQSGDDADCGHSSGGHASGGWETAVLNLHNEYRQKHGVPSLSWSTSLASKANSCLSRQWYRNGQWHLEHCNFGENIAGYFESPITGVEMWYNEIEHTHGKKGRVTQFSMHTGHYTQVVWKSSLRVGCAKSTNFLICNYDPPGNYMGQFEENVLPL